MTDQSRPVVRSPKRAEAWARKALHRTNGLGPVGLVFVSVTAFGAKGNGVRVMDASITALTDVLSSVTLDATDVGKRVKVLGAGLGGGDLIATIVTVSSGGGTATLSAPALTTVIDGVATWASDDSPAFQAAFAAASAHGYGIFIDGGNTHSSNEIERIYGLDESVNLSLTPELVVWQSPSATLQSFIVGPGSGNPSAMFYGTWMPTGDPTTTLHANVVVGTKMIDVNDLPFTPSIGQKIQVDAGLGNQDYAAIYTIVAALPGVGHTLFTVDRAVEFPFVTGNVVSVVQSRPYRIVWYGNKGVWTGMQTRAWEMLGALDCRLIDVLIDQRGGGYQSPVDDPLCSWDEASQDCWFEGCVCNFPSNCVGWGSESSEHCGAVRCVNQNCGFGIYDAIGFQVLQCQSYGAGVDFLAALKITSNGAYRSIGTTVIGGQFSGTSGSAQGVIIDMASETTLLGVYAGDNANFGMQVTGASVNATIDGCSVRHCGFGGGGGNGLIINAGAQGTRLVALDVSNTTVGLQASGDVRGSITCESVSGTGDLAAVVDSGAVADLDLDLTLAPFTFGVFVTGAGTRATLRGHVTLPTVGVTAGYLVSVAGAAVADVDNFYATGAGAGTIWQGLVSVAGTTLRLGTLSLDTLAVPLSVAGFSNRKQTLVANGGAGRAVAWPNIKSTDVVLLTVQTPSTPGTLSYTLTPGTGFTVFSTSATDASTIEYFIP